MSHLRIYLLSLLAAFAAIGCEQSSTSPQSGPQGVTQPSGNGTSQPARADRSNSQAQAGGTSHQMIFEEVDFESVKGAEQSNRRNLLILLDNSGSMEESPPRGTAGEQFKSKWAAALWAVKEVVKDVPKDDNLALFAFDGRGAKEIVPLGVQNREAFLKALDQLRSDQGTPLCGSIRSCADALFLQYQRQLGYGEYRLIIVTDGAQQDGNERDLAESVKYAARKRIQPFTVGFCTSDNHPLRRLTSYNAAKSATELKASLQQALSEADIDDTILPEGR